jgi:hypothetical protein
LVYDLRSPGPLGCQTCARRGGVDRGHREGLRYHRESHVVFAVPRPGREHTAQGWAGRQGPQAVSPGSSCLSACLPVLQRLHSPFSNASGPHPLLPTGPCWNPHPQTGPARTNPSSEPRKERSVTAGDHGIGKVLSPTVTVRHETGKAQGKCSNNKSHMDG